jgi:hypothetical protein
MPQTYYLGNRSLFVTLTAWFGIVLATLACACGLIQQASLASWAPGFGGLLQAHPVPVLGGLLMTYLPWLYGAGLMLSVALLVASCGLLMRMEWARNAFIGLLALAIVANLAGLWLQHEFVQSLVASTLRGGPLPVALADVFGGFVTAARVMGGVVTLMACGLLAWMIRRLMSPVVRQEFGG